MTVARDPCAMLEPKPEPWTADSMSIEDERPKNPSRSSLRISLPTGTSNLLVAATAAAALGLDQYTKYLVRANLRIGESWPSEGFFRLTHGTNTGTAFGLFQNQTVVLTIASIIAIGFIVYFHRKHGSDAWWSRVTIGLLLGGAFGNLVDRLIARAVTDFIDVGPWPIFNLADSSIVVGIVLLILTYLFWGERGEDRGTAGAVEAASEASTGVGEPSYPPVHNSEPDADAE